ncbi:MAG: hypothetical protein KDD94_08570 [Calditrichaeota bacterium]|nr:hypothetical protein [Calditrichota bacterium]
MKNRHILNNYNQIKSFIENRVNQYSQSSDFFQAELIETVMSHPQIVKLIQKENILLEKKELEVLNAINESKNWLKSLNHNFKELSLDSLNESYGYELAESPEVETETIEAEISLNDLTDFSLSSANKAYLETLTHHLSENQRETILLELKSSGTKIDQRVDFIRSIFPKPPDSVPDCEANQEFSDSEIIDIYKHILIGSISKFPPLFLQDKAEHKIAVLLRYLRDSILKIDTDEFYRNFGIDELYTYKLANCARHMNYSWNRLIQILEPERYLPWQMGKVSEGYWELEENRVQAIHWLIEDFFNVKPGQIWQLIRNKTLTRDSFGKLGLSYLYNTYYNSLLKCIGEAYPELNYWEIGIYPNGFWDSDDAKQRGSAAFLWMLGQEGISQDQLIRAIELKWINRQLFSKYNLSTMFDYCFNKNLFDLVDFAFPRQFKPWEIGNVKQSYWENDENHMKAIHYFMNEIQQSEFDIERMLKYNTFKKSQFKQSKLANFFKNYYNNNPDKIFFRLLKPLRLVREGNQRIYNKLKRINRPRTESRLFKFLKHGFNLHLVESFERDKQKRIARKLRSRKYILEKED